MCGWFRFEHDMIPALKELRISQGKKMHENKAIQYDKSYKRGMFKMQWGYKVKAYSIFLGKWE